MTGKLYIDGKDAYTEYGVFVQEGGYNELVAYPPLKSVTYNDWHEIDGIEPDLSALVLNTKELSIKFAFTGLQYRFGTLIKHLSDKAYHTFHFAEIGRTYKLRLISNSSIDLSVRIGFATLRFADDFPLDGYVYENPVSNIAPAYDYELDGKRLSDYGVRVLQGTLAEIEKLPDVKQNILRNISNKAGATYDGDVVTYKTKEVKINCLIRATSLSELWKNYFALLHDLIKQGERYLYCDATGREYPCYYKNSSVSEFFPIGKIWIIFSITLIFISNRQDAEEFILSSSDEQIIVTEQGNKAINLSKYAN